MGEDVDVITDPHEDVDLLEELCNDIDVQSDAPPSCQSVPCNQFDDFHLKLRRMKRQRYNYHFKSKNQANKTLSFIFKDLYKAGF